MKQFLLLNQFASLILTAVTVLALKWEIFLIGFFVYSIVMCFGITMTYHRLLSHRSWNAPKWFERLGTLIGAYGSVGSPIAWVALHREHHRHSDTELDPHAPKHKGFAMVQWFAARETPKAKYASDLIRDPFQVLVHKLYWLFLVIPSALIILPLPSFVTLTVITVYYIPVALTWTFGSLVNTLCHLPRFGYRNYKTKDDSHNVPFLGWFAAGEGWHNNHHADPSSPDFKSKWWEFDIGGFFIDLIEKKSKW